MENNSNELQSEQDWDDLSEDVDALLRQVAHFSVPDDFLAETLLKFDTAKFDTATELAAAHKKSGLALGVAVGAMISVAAAALWLILFHITLVTKLAAAMSRIGILTLQCVLEMWSSMPELGTGLMLGLWIIMFMCAAVLVKAFRQVDIHHTTAG
ncbi:MAG: hypothetical protein JXX14_14005 [Deltaproteobacteria bacterium]|nr:hypothetical protein [Deltaproteobacteria bacterium]